MFQFLRGFFVFCLVSSLAVDSFAVIKSVKLSGNDEEQEAKKDEDSIDWGFIGEVNGRKLDENFWLYLEKQKGIKKEKWEGSDIAERHDIIQDNHEDYTDIRRNLEEARKDYEAALQKHGAFLEAMGGKPWEDEKKNKEAEAIKEETLKALKVFTGNNYKLTPKELAERIQVDLEQLQKGESTFGIRIKSRVKDLAYSLYWSADEKKMVEGWLKKAKTMCQELDHLSAKSGSLLSASKKGEKINESEIRDLIKNVGNANSEHKMRSKILSKFGEDKKKGKESVRSPVVMKQEEPKKEEKKEEKKEVKQEEPKEEKKELHKVEVKKEEPKKEEPKKEEKKKESVSPEKAVEVAAGALGAPAGTYIDTEMEEKLKGEESEVKDSFEQESRQIRADRNKKLARAISGGGAEAAKLQDELNQVNLELAELREKEEISDEDIARIKALKKRSQEIQKQLLQLGSIDEAKAEKDVDGELAERLKTAQAAHDGKRKDIDERRKKYNDIGFRKHEAAFLSQSLSDDDFLRDLEIAIRTPGAGSRLTKKRMKDRGAMSRVDVNGYAAARIDELSSSNLENMDDPASKFLKSYLLAEENLEKFLVEDFNAWSSGKK